MIWNDVNYPLICGGRNGYCKTHNQPAIQSPTLIDKDHNVICEYCQLCGELIHIQTPERRLRQ